ncbi:MULTISPECIES: hypothetical protein [unclassified Carboxylicivirga]|uniref:hypothetical protein n=1 Tax=Carboxylicivirga TaxID=1628153 RepID=UPI003D35704E
MGKAKFTLTAELKAQFDDFKRGLAKATRYSKQNAKAISKSFNGVNNSLANVAGAIGITFGARELFTYAQDAVELAGQISGVEEAFNKLKGVNMDELRAQTKGTASDFQLMKAAVKAAEFGIDASKMPQLMQFAAVQANKMGESVDYMVESIVTGLARNSIPILDNLGLSSTMLKEKMKETGDISSAALAVINEKLKATGGLSDNAGVRAQQLKADFANLKAEIGKELTPAFNELFGQLKENLPDIIDNAKAVATFIANNFDLILKLTTAIGGLVIALNTAKAAQSAFNTVAKANPYVLLASALLGVAVALGKMKKGWEDARKAHYDYYQQVRDKTKDVSQLSDEELIKESVIAAEKIKRAKRGVKEASSLKSDAHWNTQLKNYRAYLKAIKEEYFARDAARKKAKAATKEQLENIASIEAEIKALQEKQKTASLEEIAGINDQIAALEKKLKLYKDATNEVDNYTASMDRLQSKQGVDVGSQVKFKKKGFKVTNDKEVNPFALAAMDNQEPNEKILDYWDELGARISDTGALVQTFEGGINTLSDAFVDMFETGEVSFKGLVVSMLDGFRQIINGLLAQAIAGMIAGESKKGILGLATASIGLAAITGLFKSKVPAFASGGIVYGETLARVGEYSGAASNPEVIAPLNKLKQLIQPVNEGLSGDVLFVLKGADLYGSIQNFETKKRRF